MQYECWRVHKQSRYHTATPPFLTHQVSVKDKGQTNDIHVRNNTTVGTPLQGDKTLISIEQEGNNSCPLSIMPSLPFE